MKKLGSVLLILISLLSTTAFSVNAANNEIARELWFGSPDPMDCVGYEDCYETVLVCIEGFTYEVGIYDYLIGASPEAIEAAAINWTGTVLTYGACTHRTGGPFVVFHAWAGFAKDGTWCILGSPSGGVGVEVQGALCFEGNPEWWADNGMCFEPVYSDDTWACDSKIGERLGVWDWLANIKNFVP